MAVLPPRPLNAASQPWGRDVEKENAKNQQALVRATMELQNTDRALNGAITRLNQALRTVQEQQEYILSLAVHYAESRTNDVALTENVWTTDASVRPSVTLRAPTGRIRVIINAYGHNALLTYSIPGQKSRDQAVSSYLNSSTQLILPGGTTTMTSQREWVQTVDPTLEIVVQVECRGVGASPVVASPSITVQVLPQP